MKYLYKKLLYLCGIVRANPNFSDTVWRSAEQSGELAPLLSEQDLKGPVKWPLLVYGGVVVAAPYLMWRLLGSLNRSEEDSQDRSWQQGVGEHFIAKEGFTPLP